MNPFRARSLTAVALVTATLVIPAGAGAADDPAVDQPQIHCSTDVPVVVGGPAGIRPQDDLVVDPGVVPADEPAVDVPAPDGETPVDLAADEAPVTEEAPPTEEAPVVIEDPALTEVPVTEEPVLEKEAVYCWAVDVPVYIDGPMYDLVPQRTHTPAPHERTAPPSSLHRGADDTTTTQAPVTEQIETTTTVPETTTTAAETTTVPESTTTSVDPTTTLPGSTRGSTTAPGATPIAGRAHFTG